jgi:hypothetical protein
VVSENAYQGIRTPFPIRTFGPPMRTSYLARLAVFSGLLTVLELATFTFTYPALPPIVVVPFVTCFMLGLSLRYFRGQLVMASIACVITLLLKGAVLPGPLALPAYGLLFQSGRARLSGALSSAFHAVYGVFIAPTLFSVAPAKLLYDWMLRYVSNFDLAILVMLVIFAAGGALSAAAGYALGFRVSKSMRMG